MLESERQLQLERERLSRDLHDSIGVYANTVLYKTERLQKEEDSNERITLMKDLKFASKDIITSLRETIWALKKDTYTAEDCLLRIRNFVQSFSGYYSHINFKVQGEAPSTTHLHYTKALNLIKIVQEAIANSIKHANPHHILVSGFLEQGKWKISITDDGTGFDYAAMQQSDKGDGLNNMQQRSAESGFLFNVETIRESGTVITIIIPA